MTKFWAGAGLVLVVGLLALFAAGATGNAVKINDLETECRYDRTEATYIDLNEDNSLSLKGHYPVENVNSDIDYSYTGGSNIVLDIRTKDVPAPVSFWNDCLASAIYDVRTPQLDEGRYSIEIKHNGERAEKKIFQVK